MAVRRGVPSHDSDSARVVKCVVKYWLGWGDVPQNLNPQPSHEPDHSTRSD
jgi:hypothetical protein